MPATPTGSGAFRTLAEMRDEHTELTARYRTGPTDPQVLAAAQRFVGRGAATGAILAAANERSAAQTLVDYWATVVFRLTSQSPSGTLLEFAPSAERSLDDRECPYPGVLPFTADTRVYFHGRKEAISELLVLLNQQDCVCIVGQSGVGKTSLLNAGLLPRLEEIKSHTSRVRTDRGIDRGPRHIFPVIVPGSDPLGNLVRSIIGHDAITPNVAEWAEHPERLTQLLGDAAPHGAVLVIDGIEELFMLCEDATARSAFASAIVHTATHAGPHLVILSIRSAWMNDLRVHEDLHALAQRYRYDLPLLTGAEQLEAILAPAARVGLTFEEGLAEALARDFVNEPPAILQMALTSLWRARAGRRVSWKTYAAIGRGRAVVCNQAEEHGVVAGSAAAQSMRQLFLAFVQPGDLPGQVRTVRIELRRLLADSSIGGTGPLLDTFVAAQLLRSSETNTPGDQRLEWVHDVLMDAVPAIAGWLRERDLEEARALTERERARANREAALKWKARRRAVAFAVAAVAAFILAAIVLRQLSQREVLLLASAAERVSHANPDLALALAVRARERSKDSAAAEGALYKAYFESATRRVYPASWTAGSNRAAISALAVAGDRRFVVTGTAQGTITAWDLERDNERWTRRIDDTDGEITAIAVSAKGDLVLAGSSSGAVVLYDGAKGLPMHRWTHHQRQRGRRDRILSLAFSPNGQVAALGGGDDTAWLWRRPGEGFGEWQRLDAASEGHRSNVTAVVFSPDGRLLFSGEEEFGVVLAWEVESAKYLGRVRRSSTSKRSDGRSEMSAGVKMTRLAIAPQGCQVLSGAEDGTVTLIDLTWTETLATHLPRECGGRREPAPRLQLSQRGAVTSLAFSPDGRHAVSGSQDWTTTIWRVTEQGLEQVKTLRGHHGRVEAVVFPAPDFFISGSADGSVRMWDVGMLNDGYFSVVGGLLSDDGKPLETSVTSVGISPDGRSTFAAAVVPGEVRILQWDGTLPPKLGVRSEYSGRLPTVFDRSGGRALTGGGSGLAVWDLSSPGKPPRRYRADPAVATFSGSALGWISEGDWSVFVVNPDTNASPRLLGKLQDAPVDNREPLYAMATSHDGRSIAVGTQDRRIVIFDTASPDAAPVRFESLHDDRITSLAFHPNGRVLASGSRDGTIVLCDLRGEVLGRMLGHTDEVTALASLQMASC